MRTRKVCEIAGIPKSTYYLNRRNGNKEIEDMKAIPLIERLPEKMRKRAGSKTKSEKIKQQFGIAINRNHYHRDGSVGLMLPGMEARISPEGEVQIRGAIVMKGYYRKPEETAEALRDGWYATGDLGYLDPDGFLFLTGRMKNLIILSNGENISPEELENDFRRDPGVKDAMVYEENQTIVAEICPEEEFAGNEAYFAELKQKINQMVLISNP